MTVGFPAVDVIILSLNRVDDTIAAIRSALEQTGVQKNVWIVDQGSDPAQLERLRRFVEDKPVILKELGCNVGVPAGRNIASQMGSAPYIVALDNDAVFGGPDTLQRAVSRLEAEPRLGAIGFRILSYFTGKDDPLSWGYPRALMHRSAEEFPAAQFVGAGHALRRAAFEAAGGYDGCLFFAWEELDLSFRMLNLGYGIKYVPDVVVLHKVSPEGRIRWDSGRFYYTVRNRLYIHWKYRAPLWRVLRSASGFLVKGAYNGATGQALRAMLDAYRMHRSLSASDRDSMRCLLHEDVRAYIRQCNLEDKGGVWYKLYRHALRRFPKSV